MTAPVRLLLDEMLSPVIAAQLRQRGMDVVAVAETPALVSMPDEEFLMEAARLGRALVTANVRDFAALGAAWVAKGHAHAGIIHVTSSAFPQNRAQVGAIVEALMRADPTGAIPGRGDELYLRPK